MKKFNKIDVEDPLIHPLVINFNGKINKSLNEILEFTWILMSRSF